jgi:hypothetical protein
MPPSDPRAADTGDALPAWAAALLAGPPPGDADAHARARARVMAAVRRAPRHGRPLARAYRLPAAAPRWARRRGLLAPGGALAGAALGAAAVWAMAAAGPRLGRGGAGPLGVAAGLTAGATVLRDTVLDAAALGAALGGPAPGGGALGDAVRRTVRATVRDTLRVVRFALAGPGARAAGRVTLAADLAPGRRASAPLTRDARTGAWSVTLVVPRDVVRYAFAVDTPGGRRWVRGAVPATTGRGAPAAPDAARSGGAT